MAVSIPGTSGQPPIFFTVLSAAGNNFAQIFADNVVGLQFGTALPTGTLSPTTAGGLNIVTQGEVSAPITLGGGGQYTYDDVAAVTIIGSTAGADTVIGSSMTYDATGDANQITLNAGDNVYQGGTSSFDTIAGGSGADTIEAGSGSGNVIFDGLGAETIVLADDKALSGDLVFLQQGADTVFANGLNDTVVSATDGALITGGTSASDADLIVFELNNLSDASNLGGTANDVSLGAGSTTIFDSVGGNTIFGGATSGSLTFIAQGPISDAIEGGAGGSSLFGSAGADISFGDSTSGGTADAFYAGAGNETLQGSNAVAGFTYFGSADSLSADSITASYTGTTQFITGLGSETLVGGDTGSSALFYVTAGGNITIDNWNANDSIAADLTGDNVSVSGGNTVITLTDNTQIQLIGFTGSLTNLYNTGS